MQVSKSGYYRWLSHSPSKRTLANEHLAAEIQKIHKISHQTYGSPRIQQELKAKGLPYGKNRIARLMKQYGIQAKGKRKFKVTTDSNHSLPIAENKLNQDFHAQELNQKWTTDITYIWTDEGWLYLAVVIDLFSRKVVGWSMRSSLNRALVIDALVMAIKARHPPKGLLHHSDRGSQYASQEYRQLLNQTGMIASMSRKGNCYDNAPTESFFASLKRELVYHRRYQSRAQAKQDIFQYIEIWYNRKRRHSTLGYVSPEEFEKRRQPVQTAA